MFTVTFVALMGLSATSSLYAQGSGDAGALPEKLKPGDSVTLSLDDTVIRGKLLAIETDKLVVRTGSGQIEVPLTAVNEVRRKRMGILLGTIIGAGAAVAPAWALSSRFANEGQGATAPALLIIGSGAAIGAGIDALLNRNRIVYRRKGTRSQVSLAPAIGTKHAGLQVSVNW